MPRAPSDKKAEAEKLFRKGMKLIDIAKKLDIPEGTIRSWKNRGKWGEKSTKKNQCNVAKDESEGNATLQKRKRGGQPGNRNAEGSKGGAAPHRNKNAEKHGAYSSIYLDALDEDELALIFDETDEEKEILMRQIGIYSVRERHLMRKIKEFEGKITKDLYVRKAKTVKHSVPDDEGKADTKSIDTSTETEHWINGLTKLEAELTKVQRAKTKSVDSLMRLKQINDEYDNVTNMRRAKADNTGTGQEGGDGEKEEVVIYIPDNGRKNK